MEKDQDWRLGANSAHALLPILWLALMRGPVVGSIYRVVKRTTPLSCEICQARGRAPRSWDGILLSAAAVNYGGRDSSD